jgi:hypothetical protein
MILSRLPMTKKERTRALASLEARAEVAERNNLPETAKAWRALAKYMRGDAI